MLDDDRPHWFGELRAQHDNLKEFTMNKITKKTAFATTGLAAAALLTVGFAGPAMADTSSDSSTSSFTSLSDKDTRGELSSKISHLISTGSLSNESPVVVAPEVGVGDVLGGGILTGDLLSGNAVASGNDVTAPVTAPIASGNEVTAPVASGNDTAVGNNSGNGTSVGEIGDVTSEVGDLVDNVTDVDGMVDGIIGDIDLQGVLD